MHRQLLPLPRCLHLLAEHCTGMQHHDVCLIAGLRAAIIAHGMCKHPILCYSTNRTHRCVCSRSALSRWRCLRTSDSCRCEAGALAICCQQTASATVALAHATPPSFHRSPLSQVRSKLQFQNGYISRYCISAHLLHAFQPTFFDVHLNLQDGSGRAHGRWRHLATWIRTAGHTPSTSPSCSILLLR